jgi:CBS domain-containing protein
MSRTTTSRSTPLSLIALHSTTPEAAGAMMINLGIRHLVVLDVADLPVGIISMARLFAILIQEQDPRALYASFTEVLEHVTWEELRPEPQ